mmetsp:Transcript_130182/g.259686  ORF Transcript_130182/g.259686 Transcript_130182/m.259686 type:complete len:199 (-) Transcript_130182:7-603(-)
MHGAPRPRLPETTAKSGKLELLLVAAAFRWVPTMATGLWALLALSIRGAACEANNARGREDRELQPSSHAACDVMGEIGEAGSDPGEEATLLTSGMLLLHFPLADAVGCTRFSSTRIRLAISESAMGRGSLGGRASKVWTATHHDAIWSPFAVLQGVLYAPASSHEVLQGLFYCIRTPNHHCRWLGTCIREGKLLPLF